MHAATPTNELPCNWRDNYRWQEALVLPCMHLAQHICVWFGSTYQHCKTRNRFDVASASVWKDRNELLWQWRATFLSVPFRCTVALAHADAARRKWWWHLLLPVLLCHANFQRTCALSKPGLNNTTCILRPAARQQPLCGRLVETSFAHTMWAFAVLEHH